ncbi:TPA: hypothetical protein N0F65_011881 [Lagenidium giganteum]|uniref:Elongator complex protein 1 n=1 Tax=Lagenidium giganteum TaxID=4803 RepID=A0AAV2YH93_9STRA|nr:TPA: hypothetical protein N0F65_011881 [Lagenidium giganteum]
MRNLRSLRRSSWSVTDQAVAAASTTALCTNASEDTTYFLDASGRIAVLSTSEPASAPQLLVDLAEAVVVEDDDASDDGGNNDQAQAHARLVARWAWMDYVAELDALVCAHTTGTLVVVTLETLDVEEIGALDGGIRGLAWSSSQEMLALCTGAGAVLVMNTQWEVLHEASLVDLLPADAVAATGHSLALASTSLELCWREDAQYLVLNVPLVSTATGAVVQKVLVLTSSLTLHALGRLEDGRPIPHLGSVVTWCPNHSLIASAEARKQQLLVVFFERNGLRHGEFALPAEYKSTAFRVQQLQWNIDSDVLAVAIQSLDGTQSILQLWTRNNYHWYLKRETRLHNDSDNKIERMLWDSENATRLHVLARSAASTTYLQEDLASVVLLCERLPAKDEAGSTSSVIAAVVDGAKLLLTPLHQALVPPPFSLHEISFDAPVNAVAFDSEQQTLLALLATGNLVLISRFMDPQSQPRSLTLENSKSLVLSSLLWLRVDDEDADDFTVTALAKSGWSDDLVRLTGRASTPLAIASVGLSDVRAASTLASRTNVVVQCHDGALHELSPQDATVPPRALQSSEQFPLFATFAAVDDGLVIGHNGRSKLYVNDRVVSPACATFQVCEHTSMLLYTTMGSASELRMTPLNVLHEPAATIAEATEVRLVGRGARLVAVIPDRASVIVQMPRGNLEAMAPRLLVLALVIAQIKVLEYAAALENCRKHRLDLNLLVDYDRQAFLEHVGTHLVEHLVRHKPARITSDRLCLFVTNLHPVNVWKTKYARMIAPFASKDEVDPDTIGDANSTADGQEDDKVNVVCRTVAASIQALDNSHEHHDALLLPVMTCAVKQSPPQYEDALTQIQTLRRDPQASAALAQAKRAMKHLALLTPVDVLFDQALGLYDVALVRFVATFSQRDPKEYMPFLEGLERVADDQLRRYQIDVHLQRHARALTHLHGLMQTPDAAVATKYEAEAIQLIQQGELHDQALRVFTPSTPFYRQVLRLKAQHLEQTKRHEDAAYVYLSIQEDKDAIRAFVAARNWSMAMALAPRVHKTPREVQAFAYDVAQELIDKEEDPLAIAKIYVEYCQDIDEAVALLVKHKHWHEALRVALLHQREDLVESDIEPGVLQLHEELMDDLASNEIAYIKHWERLRTIREQKRLFKLHGIDGSRWQQQDGDDTESVVSGAASTADSALSNASMRSVGSHNSSARSMGNFAMQSLSKATSSHFYATHTMGAADNGQLHKKLQKYGGMLPRRERRRRIQEGSAEEEQHVLQQVRQNEPSAHMRRQVRDVLQLLVYFRRLKEAEALQRRLAALEHCVTIERPSPSVEDSKEGAANGSATGTATAATSATPSSSSSASSSSVTVEWALATFPTSMS